MNKQSQKIVEIIVDFTLEDEAALRRKIGSEGTEKSREIKQAVESTLTENPAYAPIWHEFQNDPSKMKPVLEAIIEVSLETDPEIARRLEALLIEYDEAITSGKSSVSISTGGGAYIGGSVSISGGDFAGRDSIRITGDGNVVGDSGRTAAVEEPLDDDIDIERSRLYRILQTRFSMYELYTLSFDLGVDYDSLPAPNKAGKARELIEYLDRRDRLPELIRVGQQHRPDIPWSEVMKPKEGT